MAGKDNDDEFAPFGSLDVMFAFEPLSQLGFGHADKLR